VQVIEDVPVLGEAFLQPNAIHLVEVVKGLDGIHGPAFHLAHTTSLSDCQPPRGRDPLTGSSATVMGPPFRQLWDHP
jgi:hypothetical protein